MRPRLHFPRALRRVLVVSKKTRLQVEMHSARLTDDGPELSSHLSRMGFDVSRLRSAHDSHVSSLDTILRELEARKIDVKLEFAKSLRAIPAEVDLVITVGGDGTVLETAQFITSPRIPILGVNSDPDHSTGKLCAVAMTKYQHFDQTLELIQSNRFHMLQRQRIAVELWDANQNATRVARLALNEVFYSEVDANRPCTHELIIVHSGQDGHLTPARTIQRSSGVLVSTGSGSTAWIKSASAVHPKDVERVLRAADSKASHIRVSERLNEDCVFHPEDRRVLYYVRDPMLSYSFRSGEEEVFPHRGFALSVSIRSLGFDSCLALDGIFKLPVAFGTTAVLHVDPDKSLSCIAF